MVRIIVLTAALLVSSSAAQAHELAVSNFATEGLTGWEIKRFKGLTEYTLVQDKGRTVIKAHSRGTASGLFKKVNYQPARYRYLRWSWKVSDTVKNGDERTKAGDDYTARVYVVFPGRFIWQTRAINYIWANRLHKGESISNAFSGNTLMVAVESGTEKVGQWLTEERDIVDDYRRLFGGEPGEIGAIAIMTDTDNTGGEATAWYGEITISADK